MKKFTKKQYIRFGVAAVLYGLFILWMQSAWLLLGYILLVDIFLTKYIHWGAWKNVKNPRLRNALEWVDDIIFALIAVYFINVFIFQNYQIPSSSLEKSLLVGDYLFVSKLSYGPRVPNTPIAFPLVQNTLPIVNSKSYLDWPEWGYKRVKGLGQVKRDDIVVFNFPAGDTVALKMQNPDYYTLVALYGRDAIWRNKAQFGDVIYRPVDKRENYVKRCIGMPGDTIRVTGEGYEINGRQIPHSPRALKTYRVRPAIASPFLSALQKLDIPARDWQRDSVGFSLTLTGFEEYQVREELPDAMDSCFALQPMAPYTLVVPQKDRAYRLDAASLIACKEAIRTELGTKAVFREGKLFVDGKETTFFFFSQDHYWMLSDHADEAVDSRHLGFIPRDHIVGNVLFCWFSREKQRCLKPVY